MGKVDLALPVSFAFRSSYIAHLMCFLRNDFISNYLEGTISFVNDYWRMIHRASGWDGLRYWLLVIKASYYVNLYILTD